MKLGTCKDINEQKVHARYPTHTFEEITNREGIYKGIECDDDNDRLIVLHDGGDDSFVTILYFCSLTNSLFAADESHRGREFVRMDDEQFCAGIRKL